MVCNLARDEIPISSDQISNLMRHLGLRALYQKRGSRAPEAPSEHFPCLMDRTGNGCESELGRRYHVSPLQKGFLYLVEIIDLC
jgi:hypothetical protein